MVFRVLLLALLISSQTYAKEFKITVDLSTTGHDIAFSPSTLQVPHGHDVSLTYKNKATADSEIIHNVAIIKPGAKERILAKMKKRDYDLDKIREHFLKDPDVLAISKTLKPGQSDTIRFKTSNKGVHTYICLVPGHGDIMKMRGKLLVQ